MDLDQTAPTGSRSTLIVKMASKYFSRRQKHTTFVICILRVYKGEFGEYAVTIFMKYAHVCAAQRTY